MPDLPEFLNLEDLRMSAYNTIQFETPSVTLQKLAASTLYYRLLHGKPISRAAQSFWRGAAAVDARILFFEVKGVSIWSARLWRDRTNGVGEAWFVFYGT
jgi:hypothetical protein